MAAVPGPAAARRIALLTLAVGVVLADSSIVTLGLPDVLQDFDSTPSSVAWVLTAYNLVLAAAALPAARLLRRNAAGRVLGGGLVLFSAASLLCALAPSLGVLIAARCLQGLGGAAVACAALGMLHQATGSAARAAAIWGSAGALGAAVGPALGGLLTELLSWEWIFVVQVPIGLLCLLAASPTEAPTAEPARPAPPDLRHLAALAAVGAGLTAALFLLVLLLIAGWRVSPIAAALTVSVMPAAALAGGRLPGGETRSRAAAGAILLGGGLAALGLLPGAGIEWTFAPQVLLGAGLGLSLGALTEAALHGRAPLVTHGGWTLAARHAGVVVALVVLTPMFTADLERQEERAQTSVLALLLDSDLPAQTRFDLGLKLAEQLEDAPDEVPDVAPAFAKADVSAGERPRLQALRANVEDQLDRAATTAFERSFLVAAALSLLALVPLLWPRRRA
jgi:MFS family permease